MNALTYAIQKIKLEIPKEILRIAFTQDDTSWRKSTLSIDDEIMTRVIRPIVLVDTDIVGGSQLVVSLEGLTPTYADTYTVVYTVPMERTGGRDIVSVLSIGYLPFSGSYSPASYGMNGLTPIGANDLEISARKMGDSMSSVPPLSNADVEVAPGNTLIIRDQLRIPGAYQLRVMVGNEKNLNNIPRRAFLDFAALCIKATNLYIYNELRIKLDQGYLLGGQEVSSVKNYIDSLSEVATEYNDMLKKDWRAIAIMSDRSTHIRMIRMQMNPAG